MKCFNPKVIGGLAVTGLAVYLFAPSAFSAVLPLLAVAACPLGMLFMMRGMSRAQCNTAERQGKAQAAGASASASTAEAEIVRLRAEIDQLEAERANRGSERAHPVKENPAGEGGR